MALANLDGQTWSLLGLVVVLSALAIYAPRIRRFPRARWYPFKSSSVPAAVCGLIVGEWSVFTVTWNAFTPYVGFVVFCCCVAWGAQAEHNARRSLRPTLDPNPPTSAPPAGVHLTTSISPKIVAAVSVTPILSSRIIVDKPKPTPLHTPIPRDKAITQMFAVMEWVQFRSDVLALAGDLKKIVTTCRTQLFLAEHSNPDPSSETIDVEYVNRQAVDMYLDGKRELVIAALLRLKDTFGIEDESLNHIAASPKGYADIQDISTRLEDLVDRS